MLIDLPLLGTQCGECALESLPDSGDCLGVECCCVVFDPEAELGSGEHGDAQWVVVVFGVVESGDGEFTVGTGEDTGVQGIVFVYEQGVEQLIVAGGPMDLAQRQILMVQGVIAGGLQLRE